MCNPCTITPSSTTNIETLKEANCCLSIINDPDRWNGYCCSLCGSKNYGPETSYFNTYKALFTKCGCVPGASGGYSITLACSGKNCSLYSDMDPSKYPSNVYGDYGAVCVGYTTTNAQSCSVQTGCYMKVGGGSRSCYTWPGNSSTIDSTSVNTGNCSCTWVLNYCAIVRSTSSGVEIIKQGTVQNNSTCEVTITDW